MYLKQTEKVNQNLMVVMQHWSFGATEMRQDICFTGRGLAWTGLVVYIKSVYHFGKRVFISIS